MDKGTTKYVDAKAIEDDIDGIEQSISDLSDNYDKIVIDLGEAGQDLTVELESYLKKGTASYADAKGIEDDIDQEKTDRAEGDKTLQDAIEAIVVPDVSDFVTGDDLTTALSGKADDSHTHDEYLTSSDLPDEYEDAELRGLIQDNATAIEGKADETHTHAPQDLTHDHDAEYQPVGDYATNTDLDTLEGRVSTNEGDLVAIKAEQITQDGKIKTNEDKNTEQDGKISALETANQSLENKVDSLENAIVSAQYAITLSPGARGQVFVNDGNPMNVTTLDFSDPDANGVNHDFGNVKAGDLLTLATSSAVGLYEISAVIGKQLSVVAKSGNGTFAEGDAADVFVQPEFDASSYATTEYVDAQDETKYPKGVVPNGEARTYADAYALEQAVLQNAEDLANLDIPEGQQNVIVSEDLPTASDGDNGDWWIYNSTPVITDFGNYYFKRAADAPGEGYLQCLSPGGPPEMSSMTSIQFHDTNYDSKENDFTYAFAVGSEIQLNSSGDIGTYEVLAKAQGSDEHQTQLDIQWVGGDSKQIYLGQMVHLTGYVDEPSNTLLFYKDNDEWLQLGGGSGGAPEINTSQVTLAADSAAGFHDLEDGTEVLTQSDVNVYLSENVVFKGATWGQLAGRS